MSFPAVPITFASGCLVSKLQAIVDLSTMHYCACACVHYCVCSGIIVHVSCLVSKHLTSSPFKTGPAENEWKVRRKMNGT